MLDERFRALKQTRPPDLWPEIEGREPRPPRREIPWGRLGTAALALVVAAAGIAVAGRAFFGEEERREAVDRLAGPAENGLIAIGGGGRIFVIQPDGSGLHELFPMSGGQALYPWGWSADGSNLAMQGYVVDPNLAGGNQDIYVVNADGTGLRNLTAAQSDVEAEASQGEPTWSPDGKKLAFADDRGEDETRVIQVIGHDGSGRRTITDPASPTITPDPSSDGFQAYTPEWSPDGTRIVFTRYLRDGSEIYSVAPDGSDLRLLMEGDFWNQGPTWSPDGAHIAFVSNRTGSNEIFVMAADGSGLRQLTDLGAKNVGFPQWSPDGNRLVFDVLDDGDWDIWTVNADGSGQAPVTDDRGDEVSPVWAPDGTRIAYEATPIPFSEDDVSEPIDVFVMDPDGTDVDRLTSDGRWGAGLAWQPVFGSKSAPIEEHASACPIEVRYAIADPMDDPRKVRLVLEDDTPIVSAFEGDVADVVTDEESGSVEVTIRSTDLTLTYRFYLDPARSSLPSKGAAVRSGDVIGAAVEFLNLETTATDGSEPPEIPAMLEDLGCHEGLRPTDALEARLLDGSVWEIQLAEPIEVAGTDEAGAYGDLSVDGEVVAGAIRIEQRPDFSQPFEPGFDPPVLIEAWTLPDGRRAEHWNWAPSHENETAAYALWVEGPGEHMYFSAAQPIPQAELVARSLRMAEADGRIDAVSFASDRIDVVKLQALFFLIDPKAPLRGPEVRLNGACRVGQDPVPDCEEAELEVPAYTPGTEEALRGATIKRVGA